MAKSKFKLTIPVEDQNTMKAISDAHALANFYRAQQQGKVEAQSLEKFLMNCVAEGVNAMFRYHAQVQEQQAKQQAEQQQPAAESATESAETEPVAEPAVEGGDNNDQSE